MPTDPPLVFQKFSSNGVLAIPARVIATSFAIICFVCTLILGMYNGNDRLSVLIGALAAAGIAMIVGRVVGALILRTVDDHIERYKAANPIPEDNPESDTDPTATAAG